MTRIPLEDSFTDIVGKAQRGFKLTEQDLARRAGVTADELARLQSGAIDETVIRKVARSLNLGKTTLVESAQKAWYPNPQEVVGLAQFNTPYADMTVNAYLVWDPASRAAAVFDTGATCAGVVGFAQANGLTVKLILLTHTHPDHIADLARLKQETGAPAYVGELEPVAGAEGFAEGREFRVDDLRIETRLTTGHSRGGITYVLSGLAKPLAVVGDALFAGSMGGGAVSYLDALANNRKKILLLADETVLCPGHGPLSTVGEEKLHNPFFPEFQKP
ncbi:MAG: MBL fold metallo-hydrolase [Verrucomicrobia bacterium]|nr:MBL fold metallo-hydrolase [Verrucomicrobiota bacterium]